MKTLLAIAALLSIGAAAPVPPPQIPYVAIRLVQCGNALGTAFHIGNGRYITANHVVSGGTLPCRIGGEEAPVVYQGKARDIAELRGPVLATRFDLDCDGFKAGAEYMAIGMAFGSARTNIPMLYSAFGNDPDNGNGQFIGAEMIPGMSGGPMIDRRFRVAGVNLQRWPSRALDLRDSYLCRAA
jgi:S1-C subfamily serine protease